jgi:AcrR family transcriptional regulator
MAGMTVEGGPRAPAPPRRSPSPGRTRSPVAPRRAVDERAAPSTVVGGAPAQERTLRSQGRKTLRKLLDAGIVVLDRRGYHAARVDDICRLAKTSHGTFYLYFSSKEDLFRALLADVSQEMVSLSDSLPSIGPGPEGYRALRGWLERFYDLYLHYHPVLRAWAESEVGNIDLARMGAGVLGGFMTGLVQRLEEVDPPPVPDPATAAAAVVAMVERFSYFSVIQIVPLERDVMLDTLATIVHRGLFAGPRRRKR